MGLPKFCVSLSFFVSFNFRKIFVCSTFELFSIVSTKFRMKGRKVFQKSLQGFKIDAISCLRCCTYMDIDVGQTSTFFRQLNYQKLSIMVSRTHLLQSFERLLKGGSELNTTEQQLYVKSNRTSQ